MLQPVRSCMVARGLRSVDGFDEFQEYSAAVPGMQKGHRATTGAGTYPGCNRMDVGSRQSGESLIQVGDGQADVV